MTIARACILPAAVALLLISLLAIIVNYIFFKYPGNNYFPPATPVIALILFLMYYGFTLQNGRSSKPALIIKEVLTFFIITAVLVFATNAAQYTPFPTIDRQIINFEAQWNINISAMMAWTYSHPLLQHVLACTYDTLPLQMCFLPLIVITTMRFDLLSEYYFLLLVSCLLGFTFYYFFPTIAPASMIDSPYFQAEQLATGVKFKQIHHYIQPATLEGGMIAMPSFHAIWAWLCLYLLREWRIAFAVLLPINLLLVASCVLLGWHYPLDVAGSLIIILISHSIFYVCRKGVENYRLRVRVLCV